MKSLQFINKCINIRQLFLPQVCQLCLDSAGDEFGICTGCWQELPWLSATRCPCCALASPAGELCGHCLQQAPAFEATLALFRYEYPLDAMLQRYKYSHALNMAHTFAGMLLQSLSGKDMPDLLIPMPLHPQRLRERGFNQALEISRIVAGERGIELDARSCVRTRLSPPQVSLPLKQRVKNAHGSFQCNARLDGLNVALVDDVMTTGASLNELAKTVKAAGAAHVECWVVARTLPR
jgi:ComF family protein